jgi:hypothetical protein
MAPRNSRGDCRGQLVVAPARQRTSRDRKPFHNNCTGMEDGTFVTLLAGGESLPVSGHDVSPVLLCILQPLEDESL